MIPPCVASCNKPGSCYSRVTYGLLHVDMPFFGRLVACPLLWLPVLLAGAPPTLNNVFTTSRAALQTALEAYVATAEATSG